MQLDKVLVYENNTIQDVLKIIDLSGLGVAFVVSEEKELLGVLSDGDLRRLLLSGLSLSSKIGKNYNTNPIRKSINSNSSAILSEFNDDVRVIPLVNERNILIDYSTRQHVRNIPIAEPNLKGNELTYVHDCLASGWISSQGAYVEKFEANFERYLGLHSLAVSNGTVAIHLALTALGVGRGDEVIVPDLTFAATINAVLYCGATPVLADVDENTWNIDLNHARELISQKTKAIIAVHLYGNSSDMDALSVWCDENNLLLIEDCAESLGTEFRTRPTGSFGDASTFSFFGNKTITTGEGGMVCFRSEDIYRRAQILRDHGMSKTKRYWHEMIGFNYRLTNVQAAIGVAQMERLSSFVSRKSQIAKRYIEEFSSLPIKFQIVAKDVFSSYWLFSITLNSEKERDDVANYLNENGVESRKIFYPLSEMEIYKPFIRKELRVSSQLSKKGLSLPTYPSLTPDELDKIIMTFKKFFHER